MVGPLRPASVSPFLLALLMVTPSPAGVPPRGEDLREVIVVFKTHFDIGYTAMAREIVQRYRTSMIDQALQMVDRNRTLPEERQFVWTLPGWPMTKILEDWVGQTPDRRERIQQAFKEGRFVVHALPFTTHTELLEPEELVRALGFSSRISRAASLPLPRDAKMTDVPSHCWILPTLLRNAGVEFLHLGCNPASRSPRVPLLFWWEGPDGSRLLTMYSETGYGTGLIPPGGWKHRTWLALYHTGDNEGPPPPEEVSKIFAQAAKELPGVRIRIGRLSDFAEAVLAEKSEIPVVRGDMPDTWIHGPMSDPAGNIIARAVRPFIGTTETLHTLLRAWGLETPDPSAVVTEAYEQSLLYGEHTWGGALSWVTEYGKNIRWDYGERWKDDRANGRFTRLEASWSEHTSAIERARDLVSPVLRSELQALADSSCAAGWRAVVFNPLPWKRDGFVTIARPTREITSLLPADGGAAVPAAADATSLRFLARDVPPLGYRTFLPAQMGVDAGELVSDAASGTLENRWFKIVLDPMNGAIASCIEKSSGRELVEPGGSHRFGQYLYERFDSMQVAAYVRSYVKTDAEWGLTELGKPNLPPASKAPYRAASPAHCEVRLHRTPVLSEATMHSEPSGILPHGVTTRIILYAGEPYVEFEISLHDKPADAWPEAGWLCFPLRIDSPQFRLGRAGSIIDPVRDIVPGTNHHFFGINTGVAVFDPTGWGVGLSPLEMPLVSLDTPGCWKYSAEFAPKRPAVYLNLFNNQWSTNFRLWNEGSWTFRVRLWAFNHYDAGPSLIAPAMEARYPLQAAVGAGVPGTVPLAASGVEVSSGSVMVTAFGRNPEGPGTLLRLWEYAGVSGQYTVRLPAGMGVTSFQPVNLRGEPLGPDRSVIDGTFSVTLNAFAPASFVLKTGRGTN